MRSKAPLNIYIKPIFGETISLTVIRSDTIGSVKDKIQEQVGIPPIQHELFFAGEELQDEKDLHDYNIEDESTLHLIMRLPDREKKPNFIRTISGKAITLETEPSSTISYFKRNIQDPEVIPPGVK